MKNIKYIIYSGIAFLSAGVAILVAQIIGILASKKIISILFILSGIFAIANSNYSVKWEDLIVRFIAGFLEVIGAVLILAVSAADEDTSIMITGFITVAIGIGTIVSSNKIKNILVE